MKTNTYTLTASETLTINVDRPTTLTGASNPDDSIIYDRTEATTIDQLRSKLLHLGQQNAALHRELDQYRP